MLVHQTYVKIMFLVLTLNKVMVSVTKLILPILTMTCFTMNKGISTSDSGETNHIVCIWDFNWNYVFGDANYHYCLLLSF